MKKYRKFIIIAAIVVVVLGATLGAVAVAQADNQPAATSANTTTPTVSIWDRISSILKTNNGVTVSGADLQKASDQAHQQMQNEALDTMLKKLVTDGKITQAQADAYKTWLAARPTTIISDQYKNWLNSMPQGLPFGPGAKMPAMPKMPRGFGGMGHMFGR